MGKVGLWVGFFLQFVVKVEVQFLLTNQSDNGIKPIYLYVTKIVSWTSSIISQIGVSFRKLLRVEYSTNAYLKL